MKTLTAEAILRAHLYLQEDSDAQSGAEPITRWNKLIPSGNCRNCAMESDWGKISALRFEEWICRFANEIGRLGLDIEPGLLLEWSFQMWRTDSARYPEEVARDEYSNWPH